MQRDPSAHPSVAAAAVVAALRRAARSARDEQRARASFAESALWSVVSAGIAPGARNRNWATLIHGPLDVAALRASLGDLIARHAGLRAGYLEDGGQLWRTSARQCWVRLPMDDLSHGPAGMDCESAALLWAGRVAARAIDLAQAPLLRVNLARLGPTLHAAVISTHRLIADGWSQALLLRELGERYALHRGRDAQDGAAVKSGMPTGMPTRIPPEMPTGMPPEMPTGMPPGMQPGMQPGMPPAVPPAVPPVRPAPAYAGWAQAQRERVEDPAYQPVIDWWAHRLENLPELALRTDRPRPERPTYAGGRVPLRFDAPRTRALRAMAWRAGVTPFVVWLSLWQLALAQQADQRDFVLATPVTHRDRADTAQVIGCLADQMALRANLAGDPGFDELLRRNRESVHEAVGLRGAPWALAAPGLVARAAFTMQSGPALSLTLADCDCTPLSLGEPPSFHDLSLHLEPHGDEFEGVLAYARELFEPETAERIAAHVGVLLDAVLARPDTPVETLISPRPIQGLPTPG